uniref:Uncharacterized protein n=1 Tax=Sinocyclocheilus grahami TaxID=75366 RepID=A0A672K717_SINGR
MVCLNNPVNSVLQCRTNYYIVFLCTAQCNLWYLNMYDSRAETFISDIYFTDWNLRGRLFGDTQPLESISVFLSEKRIPYSEAVQQNFQPCKQYIACKCFTDGGRAGSKWS